MSSFSPLPPVPDEAEQTFLRDSGLLPLNQTDNGGLAYTEDWQWSPGTSELSSDRIITTFQQTLMEQPDRHELSTIDPASTSLINDGLPPTLAEDSALELPYQASTATFPSRSVRNRRSAHRRYNNEKWDSMKDIIQELYIDQGYPLLQVIRILETTYKFTASYVSSPILPTLINHEGSLSSFL